MHIQRGTYNVPEIRTAFQTEMSRVADFDRSVMGMTKFLEKVNQLYENFFDTVSIEFDAQVVEVFKLYDMILTQRLELRMPLSNPLDRSPGDKQKANLPNGCLPMIS